MKKKLPSFLAGFLCAILLISLTVGVYAASEWPKTIEVGHINIMVNGKEFQPTDSKGRPVDVFVYKGTTYAPLRALAEAYGLDVWYDSASNLATVGPKGSAPSSSTHQTSSKPDITAMYTASTYYPYDIPSITSVTQLRPVLVTDGTTAKNPNYGYQYEYDEYSWNFYRQTLQSKGYTIVDTSNSVIQQYEVYISGIHAMDVLHHHIGSTDKILVFVNIRNSGSSQTSVQPTQTEQQRVISYSGYPGVPDFGSLFNVPCEKTFSNQETMMYLYNVSSLPSGCMITYGDYVHDRGFRFLGEFPDSAGNTVFAFSNGTHNVSIGTMWVDNAGYIAIMITHN